MITTATEIGKEKLRVLLVPLIIAATISLPYFKAESANIIGLQILSTSYVDGELKYQLLTLGLAGIILLLTFALGPRSFKKFFSVGKINAPVEPVKLIGLNPKPGEGWVQVGRNFAIIISAVTFVFIYFQLIRGNSIEAQHLGYLPWVLVFAVSNSFVEEMITRFGVVSALDGLISKEYVYLTSATVFGLAHYWGVPGGIPGVLLAGFLGWLLAKSIGETGGIFWAWLIHFLQDIIIFTGLFFVNL